MIDFDTLEQVSAISDAANEIADLAMAHQTPQMLACLASFKEDTWRRMVLAVRIPDDRIRLAAALGWH